ncbi:MAG TPA: hypothetical protein VFP60_19540 [Pseudolabrys sp.]|nr:hypothetical protein [Pseudolabrys sp.]
MMVLGYDAETLALLRATLDEAWASLRADEKASASKAVLARHILRIAESGERDPIRLRNQALCQIVTSTL